MLDDWVVAFCPKPVTRDRYARCSEIETVSARRYCARHAQQIEAAFRIVALVNRDPSGLRQAFHGSTELF